MAAKKDRNLVPALSDPWRFVAAVLAAFAVAHRCSNPHAWLLAHLVNQLKESVLLTIPPSPTAVAIPLETSDAKLTAQLAPGLQIMLEVLFGPPADDWQDAVTAFRSRYVQGLEPTAVTLPAFETEIEHAETRFFALVCLTGGERAEKVRAWLQNRKMGTDPARHAIGLVAAAAQAPLRWLRSDRRLEQDLAEIASPNFFDTAGWFADAAERGLVGCLDAAEIDASGVDVALIDSHLIQAQSALPLLAQQVLVYTITQIDPAEGDLRWQFELRADDFAEWAQLDVETVRREFSYRRDTPADAVRLRPLVVPGFRRPGDEADCAGRDLGTRWFSEVISLAGGDCPRVQVTFDHWLAPYLSWICERYYRAFESGVVPTDRSGTPQ